MKFLGNVYRFYAGGFRSLSPRGRLLWLMILLKVAILFLVFKLWLMPASSLSKCDSDDDRARAVRHELMAP